MQTSYNIVHLRQLGLPIKDIKSPLARALMNINKDVAYARFAWVFSGRTHQRTSRSIRTFAGLRAGRSRYNLAARCELHVRGAPRIS